MLHFILHFIIIAPLVAVPLHYIPWTHQNRHSGFESALQVNTFQHEDGGWCFVYKRGEGAGKEGEVGGGGGGGGGKRRG